jgi:HK97 gp10 family phage protein
MALKAVIKFINNRNVVNREIGKFITRAVSRSIKVMERNVKVNTPVKEGHLRRSIQSRMTGQTSGEVFNAAVEGGREINYAVHVEYGTRHMAPRAMFRKGVADSEDRIKEIFAEEARKVHDKASGNK